jgi:hypothetical protein
MDATIGGAALVTWGVDSHVPDIVKTLGLVALGLLLAVTTAFLQPAEQ